MAEKDESVKLFVEQVPTHMTESQLLSIFKRFAIVDQLISLNKTRRRSSPRCCLLKCPDKDEADKIINACHNKMTLQGASGRLQVKYCADSRLGSIAEKGQGNTLYIGKLPESVSDADISALFAEYGNIDHLKIVRDSNGICRGFGFLKFETEEQAIAAIQALDGKHKMKSSTVPLAVELSETELKTEPRSNEGARSMSEEAPNQDTDSEHNQGAFPVAVHIPPPYYGFGYLTSYGGPMSFLPPPFYNYHAFHNMHPHYAVMHGLAPPPHLSATPSSWSVRTSSVRGHIKGPPGANLFVKHIPQDISEHELANIFQRCGTVLYVKLIVDKITRIHQRYGYVSYDSPFAAQNAVLEMNGFQLGDKRLTVEYNRKQHEYY